MQSISECDGVYQRLKVCDTVKMQQAEKRNVFVKKIQKIFMSLLRR